ncbi:hypothetical protein EXU85_02360 [Spirosoma sp. KCTC 42546]|uniref:5-fold beta-flower protein n=1 Tax=Spirosoma sp. KCTC 42546 TaxID=2520506 RepID=UPI001159FD0E|nr:hypothetical protein [Spirosoma sp. KCTC 42546]QDK77501.1 hypothetical protein EXU85_02360 [Spirosoma sp. KCTC 42546]
MKNAQKWVLLVAIALLPSWLLGQSPNYKQPMSINAQGQIKDSKGTSIGLVSKDKIIKDANGQKIAFVDGQGDLVDAKTGKKMGRIGKDGKTYYDINGELVFTVKDNADETCDIVDAKGKKIGNVHDSYKSLACALHCFQNQHTHMSRK